MFINANDKAGPLTHIIDKKTGKDLTKKFLFSWWDSDMKQGKYMKKGEKGEPLYETERIAIFPDAKTLIDGREI